MPVLLVLKSMIKLSSSYSTIMIHNDNSLSWLTWYIHTEFYVVFWAIFRDKIFP